MFEIISLLRESPVFTVIELLELIDEESVKLIKIKAETRKACVLYITELHTSEFQKYSYHFQDGEGNLIVRWDNRPHWPGLITYPHHRHEGKKVLASERANIAEVIKVIEKCVGQRA